MPEYIDRKSLGISKCNPDVFKDRAYAEGWNAVIDIIENAPAEDVVEVVHSKWMLYTDGSGECERCHIRQKNVWDFDGWQNFCGYCGAKMDGKRKDGNEECLNS